MRAQAQAAEPAQLTRLFDLAQRAVVETKLADQPRHALEVALLKAVFLAPGADVSALIARVEALAGGALPPAPAPGGGGSGGGRAAPPPQPRRPPPPPRAAAGRRHGARAPARAGAPDAARGRRPRARRPAGAARRSRRPAARSAGAPWSTRWRR